jgi:hypothetical protein
MFLSHDESFWSSSQSPGCALAAAEHVSETVIAAVLLLHERSVEEIAPELSATELEQVIKLVG